jgi:hypothetical protein
LLTVRALLCTETQIVIRRSAYTECCGILHIKGLVPISWSFLQPIQTLVQNQDTARGL